MYNIYGEGLVLRVKPRSHSKRAEPHHSPIFGFSIYANMCTPFVA